jgi:hypothetical protein
MTPEDVWPLIAICAFGIGYAFGLFKASSNLKKFQRHAKEHPDELYNPDSISDWERWKFDQIQDHGGGG